MTACDSDISKFILEWRNIVRILEAYDMVLKDKFKIMWHAFEICKDAYFVEYMGHKQEAHEEDESPTSLHTVDKLLKFSLNKYMERSRIDNHVCRSSSKREAEFVALAAEVTTLKGNVNLSEKISKMQKLSGGGGGASPKFRTGNKHNSQKEMSARLSIWKIDCISLKKVPPTLGGPSTRNFTKK